jgi:hypothetical protein
MDGPRRHSLPTGNGELEDLTVRQKVVGAQKMNDGSEEENGELASIVGLKKVTNVTESVKRVAASGHEMGGVSSKSAVASRQMENESVVGRSSTTRVIYENGADANAVKKENVVKNGHIRGSANSVGDVARIDTVEDFNNSSTGLCLFRLVFLVFFLQLVRRSS